MLGVRSLSMGRESFRKGVKRVESEALSGSKQRARIESHGASHFFSSDICLTLNLCTDKSDRTLEHLESIHV